MRQRYRRYSAKYRLKKTVVGNNENYHGEVSHGTIQIPRLDFEKL